MSRFSDFEKSSLVLLSGAREAVSPESVSTRADKFRIAAVSLEYVA
jgi:hypothetical protein